MGLGSLQTALRWLMGPKSRVDAQQQDLFRVEWSI